MFSGREMLEQMLFFFLEVKENLGKGRVFEKFFPHTKAWWERFLFSKLANIGFRVSLVVNFSLAMVMNFFLNHP